VAITQTDQPEATAARRPVADRLMRGLARLLVRVFFRRVEVAGSDLLPERGPVVVVANHTNGLVDGLLLIALLDRYPRFLGKATLFEILPLKPFLKLAGVVPVHRVADRASGTELADAAGNDRAFARCRQLLAEGGVVAIFPEGISHDEAQLQPLRTGAARIALGAAFDAGVEDVVVVPVGLAYDAKARFRSRALLTIGSPFAAGVDPAAYREDPRAATRDLTEHIATELRNVGPDYDTVAQAELLARVADVAALVPAEGRAQPAPLAARDQIARALAEAERDPGNHERVERLVAAQARYDRDLDLLGVTDADVASDLDQTHYRRTMLWATTKAVVTAPVALAGAVVHAVPYQVMKRVAARPQNEGMKSTVKLLGCAVLFLVEWIVLAVVAGVLWGPVAALATLVGCPLAGYVTVRFAEGVHDAGGLAHGWHTLRSSGAALASVRADRAEVVDLASALVRPAR
jgi:1-acyl-sn-glycerol-3-phosphate acyltransferase